MSFLCYHEQASIIWIRIKLDKTFMTDNICYRATLEQNKEAI